MEHSMGGGGDAATCKISMLWNWTTVDACFLASSWHITSRGMFAASIIGIFLLSVSLEALRRLAKEYEIYATRQLRAIPTPTTPSATCSSRLDGLLKRRNRPRRATPLQQLIRAFLHALVFAVAYILMLLAMYFNGYVIITIFVGVGVGKYICDWLVLEDEVGEDGKEEEFNPTVCCG